MQIEPSKADPPKRKRRWFQFSLRSLMIVTLVIAVPCAYVGWQEKVVRERRAEFKRAVDGRLLEICGNGETIVIPWFRRVLGDHRVASIKVPTGTDAAELDRLRVLFPEAEVKVWTPADQITR
jgi:hypothetical protein